MLDVNDTVEKGERVQPNYLREKQAYLQEYYSNLRIREIDSILAKLGNEEELESIRKLFKTLREQILANVPCKQLLKHNHAKTQASNSHIRPTLFSIMPASILLVGYRIPSLLIAFKRLSKTAEVEMLLIINASAAGVLFFIGGMWSYYNSKKESINCPDNHKKIKSSRLSIIGTSLFSIETYLWLAENCRGKKIYNVNLIPLFFSLTWAITLILLVLYDLKDKFRAKNERKELSASQQAFKSVRKAIGLFLLTSSLISLTISNPHLLFYESAPIRLLNNTKLIVNFSDILQITAYFFLYFAKESKKVAAEDNSFKPKKAFYHKALDLVETYMIPFTIFIKILFFTREPKLGILLQGLGVVGAVTTIKNALVKVDSTFIIPDLISQDTALGEEASGLEL